METQREEDEISSNDIIAGLLRTDRLSHSATGQVASIFIRDRNPICNQLVSLLDAPRYLCRLSDSAEQGFNQIQRELHQYSSQLLGRKVR